MTNAFYTHEELARLGLASFGKNVRISRNARIYSPENLHLGSHVRIDDFCVISAGGGIRIGDYVHIAPFCGLYGGAGIEIGDFSGISSRVALYSVSDDFSGFAMVGPMVPTKYRMIKSAKITLGKHGVIGTGATVMPGVTAPLGVAIGAHSLVFADCDAWSVYAGNPAVRIGPRSNRLEKLEKLLRQEAAAGI